MGELVRLLLILVSCCAIFGSSLRGAAQENDGNVIYLRNEAGVVFAVNYANGYTTTLGENRCIRSSPNRDYMASYELQEPRQIVIIDLANGETVTRIEWRTAWGSSLDDVGFCGVTNQWVDNTIFRLPDVRVPNQFYDVNRVTAAVETVSVNVTADSIVLPLVDPGVAELGLGVAATLSPSGSQAIYSQCEQDDCTQTRYVLYDTQAQRVLAELTSPGFNFYFARLIPGDSVFAWSHDERDIAIASFTHTLAIYNNAAGDWLDLSFLPDTFDDIERGMGGWNWSPDDTQIAFAAQRLKALGYAFDSGIMVMDLAHQTYRAFELGDTVSGIYWLPNEDGLLILAFDGQLYQLNLATGSFEAIDDHVSNVLVWYPSGSDFRSD